MTQSIARNLILRKWTNVCLIELRFDGVDLLLLGGIDSSTVKNDKCFFEYTKEKGENNKQATCVTNCSLKTSFTPICGQDETASKVYDNLHNLRHLSTFQFVLPIMIDKELSPQFLETLFRTLGRFLLTWCGWDSTCKPMAANIQPPDSEDQVESEYLVDSILVAIWQVRLFFSVLLCKNCLPLRSKWMVCYDA